jgi:signal transduction histidine kinase
MPDTLRVLLVEDSEDDAALILREFTRAGLHVASQRVDTAAEMSAALAAEAWDLVIADYNLPRFDAPTALNLAHERDCDLPFIVVSGTIGEETAVEIMRAGAHDYVLKGNLTRLIPAVQRELREAGERRRRRAAELELQRRQETIRQLAAEVALAEQKERRRTATVIHDDICQILAFAKIKLGETREAQSEAKREEGLQRVNDLLGEAIQDARNLIYDLSNPVLLEQGLTAALEWTADNARDRHGLPIEMVLEGVVPRLPENVEVTVFQAVKELLNNVVKHAEATHVALKIACVPPKVSITVMDDGCGFDPATLAVYGGGGFGLLNLRERLAYVGGTMEIESSPGRGCRTTITVLA